MSWLSLLGFASTAASAYQSYSAGKLSAAASQAQAGDIMRSAQAAAVQKRAADRARANEVSTSIGSLRARMAAGGVQIGAGGTIDDAEDQIRATAATEQDEANQTYSLQQASYQSAAKQASKSASAATTSSYLSAISRLFSL